MEFTDVAAPHVGCAANSLAHILMVGCWDGTSQISIQDHAGLISNAQGGRCVILVFVPIKKKQINVFVCSYFFDQNINFEDFVIFFLTCIHFED